MRFLPVILLFESIYSLYIQGTSCKSLILGINLRGVNPYTATLAYVDGFDDDGNRLGVLNAEGKYVYNMDYDLTTQLAMPRGYLGRSYPPITGGFTTSLITSDSACLRNLLI